MCLQFILFYLLVPFEVTAAWVRCECTPRESVYVRVCARLQEMSVRKSLYGQRAS